MYLHVLFFFSRTVGGVYQQRRTLSECASVRHLLAVRGPDGTIQTRPRLVDYQRNARSAIHFVDPHFFPGVCRLDTYRHSLPIGRDGLPKELIRLSQDAKGLSVAIHPGQFRVYACTCGSVDQSPIR
jgi:hypothetical protein